MKQIAYSIEEASSVSGICRTSIYSLLKTGQIKGVKQGRKTLIVPESLEAYVAGLPSYEPQSA